MSAVGAIILSVLVALIFLGSRKWALLGFAAGILYLTQGESIDVFGFNLYAHRFLELAGIGRIILRHEFSFSNLNRIDKAFLYLYLYTTIVFVLRSSEGLTYQIGYAVDAMFAYFTFRGLITSIDEFNWFLKRFAVLLVPYVVLVLIERITRQNPFAIVGANYWILNYREGIPRCSGSFRHAILLGSFGTSFIPLYVGYLFKNKDKIFALVGVGACMGIVAFSYSGGPLSSFVIGLAGWGLWKFRDNMRLVKIGMGFGLVFIALFMNAPIWALPFKVSQITGGGGWHRYYLLEMTIQNFSKWWLAGMPMEETIYWFPYMLESTGGADITNQFVAFGITAGLFAIFLFVVLLIKSFSVIGKAMANAKNSPDKGVDRYFIWGVGVMLVVHISNYFGVTYFDQMKLVWYMQLALISMLADKIKMHRKSNGDFGTEKEPNLQL